MVGVVVGVEHRLDRLAGDLLDLCCDELARFAVDASKARRRLGWPG
jgi:hypothetical protein